MKSNKITNHPKAIKKTHYPLITRKQQCQLQLQHLPLLLQKEIPLREAHLKVIHKRSNVIHHLLCNIEADPQQTPTIELPQTERHIDSRSNIQDRDIKKREKEAGQEKTKQTENPESDQNLLMQTILQELKSIKMTIHLLGEKVDSSCENLAKNTTENTELKKVITFQNNQISTLINDNTILKQKNKSLEKDLKEMED